MAGEQAPTDLGDDHKIMGSALAKEKELERMQEEYTHLQAGMFHHWLQQ